jgi:hypothetical protein
MISEKVKKKIQDYYADPEEAETKRFFDWAAKQRFAKESPVAQIEDGAKVSRTFVVQAMKELDRLGFGKFVVGRRGNQSRMIWNVGLGDLGRCAQGKDVNFNAPEPLQGSSEEADLANAEMKEILHFYQLRPDLRISFRLPSDLTPVEAKRVADFILSLSFERSAHTNGQKG